MRIRRVRVVSEPLPEYPRWQHACTDINIKAGEDIRWLPRTKAAGLLLPGADCWVSGHRVVRWNFQRGVSVPPPARLAAARPMLNLAALSWRTPPSPSRASVVDPVHRSRVVMR